MSNIERFPSFDTAIHQAGRRLAMGGNHVHVGHWQGVDIKGDARFSMFEVNNYAFQVPIRTTDLEILRSEIKPNLPWADDHFLERVGGVPLNPGEQYKNWPFYKRDRFRTEGEKFTHTYMERFWPKKAGEVKIFGHYLFRRGHMEGIRYPYGNLDDVVDLLIKEPLTRQAYFPIWFPEDTGVLHGGRVPCTLGYQFLIRDERLHITYHIRSCDYFRHFRDDIYLACRLNLWVINEINDWVVDRPKLGPGNYTMHITNLHIFSPEEGKLRKELNLPSLP